MSKSVYSTAHSQLVSILIAARHASGLQQTELAARIGKSQAYISNIERGQRRIDVLEFYAIARAMNTDPVQLFKSIVDNLPITISI